MKRKTEFLVLFQHCISQEFRQAFVEKFGGVDHLFRNFCDFSYSKNDVVETLFIIFKTGHVYVYTYSHRIYFYCTTHSFDPSELGGLPDLIEDDRLEFNVYDPNESFEFFNLLSNYFKNHEEFK